MINYRQVLGGEKINLAQESRLAGQNEIENYYKNLENQRNVAEAELKASKLTRSAPMEVDGNVVVDWLDAQGNPVKREVVGKATRNDQAKKLFKTKDGKVEFFGPGEVPDGAIPWSDTQEGGLTPAQEFNQAKSLADIEARMVDGSVEVPEALAGDAEVFNKYHPTQQWKLLPFHDSKWNEMGTNSDAKWVKLPKNPSELLALPEDQVVSRNPQTGDDITVGMAKSIAKAKGVSEIDVLKFLGLVQ